jgi:hypothetical protein
MKTPKHYPMNGPSLEIQRLMAEPKKNRARLIKWKEANATMRKETLDHIK